MVYLRKKKVKGVDYLYLVKSTWDKVKKTSKQETIKYLGESSAVTRDDIPTEYRDNAKINSFLLQNTPKDREKREKLIEQLRTKLFSSLTEGSLKETMNIYNAFVSRKEWNNNLHDDLKASSSFEVSPMGSIALKLGFMAMGVCHIVISRKPKCIWDISAGNILLFKRGINCYIQGKKLSTMNKIKYEGNLVWASEEIYQLYSDSTMKS